MSEKIKLDVKDKKIIYQLSLNGRVSISKIAKRVGSSPQVVEYRLKRLIKKDVIRYFYTCIDISKIGYSIFKIYIKFQNLDEQKEKEMIEDFVRNPNITWVASCDGNWDLYLVIWSKNVFQFNKTFTEINNKYSFYFSRKSIIANTKVLQFMRKYLASKKEDISYKTVVWAGEISNVSLDKIDFKILATISQDARLSDSEIGKKIGISRKIVTYRIRKMINSGVIYGFKPFLNGDLLNFKTYKILLTLQSLTSDKETGLVNFLNHHPNVIEVIHCIGNWEMELDVESLGIEENHDLIRRLKNEFTHVIRECEPLLIYKTYKYDYLPKKLVQLKIRK